MRQIRFQENAQYQSTQNSLMRHIIGSHHALSSISTALIEVQ